MSVVAIRRTSKTSTQAARADEIREALVRHLTDRSGKPGIVLHELRVGSGERYEVPAPRPRRVRNHRGRLVPSYRRIYPHLQTTAANVDVALLQPHSLDLYEIKGAGDSLTRLRRQVPAYDQSGSTCTLVVDAGHAEKAARACPDHWGLLKFEGGRFIELRPAQPNQCRSRLGVLWPLQKQELLPLALACGYERSQASHAKLVEVVVERTSILSIETLATWLYFILRSRDHYNAYDAVGAITGPRRWQPTIVGEDDVKGWPLSEAGRTAVVLTLARTFATAPMGPTVAANYGGRTLFSQSGDA